MIAVFWVSFIFGIAGVSLAASIFEPDCKTWLIVGATGILSGLSAILLPFYFGLKLQKLVKKEKDAEDEGEWKPYRLITPTQ